MSNTFSLPVPGGAVSFTPNGIVFTPTGGNPLAFPQLGSQQLGQQLTLPNLQLPNLTQGGAPPDLSALLPVLTPIISAAVPGIGPLLPIIGAVLHILYTLVTQVNAANASGTPNPVLQNVHDAAWQQVLSAFGQKPATTTTA